MPEQVFEIAALKKRVVELLAREGGYLAAGTVAAQLGVPLYAVHAALDAAASEVQYRAGAGWRALSATAPAAGLADEGQGNLLAGGA